MKKINSVERYILSNLKEICLYGSTIHPNELTEMKMITSKKDMLTDKKMPLSTYNSDFQKTSQIKTIYKLEELLLKSIESSLSNNKIPTFLLSGGMDSSVLYKLMKEHGIKPEVTFSTSFPFKDKRKGNIEKAYVQDAINKLKIENHIHSQITISQYFCRLVDVTYLTRDICHMNSTPLLFSLFEDAINYFNKKGIKGKKVLICGQGADCFLGMTAARRMYKYNSLAKTKKIISNLHSFLYHPLLHRYLTNFIGSVNSNWENEINGLLNYIAINKSMRSYSHFAWQWSQTIKDNSIAKRVDTILSRFSNEREINPYDLLCIHDYYSTLAFAEREWGLCFQAKGGSNICFPFYENDIVSFLQSIPWSYRLSEKKKLFLELGRKLDLSDEFLLKPKTGLSVHPNHGREYFNIFFGSINSFGYGIEESYKEFRKLSTTLKQELNFYKAWLLKLMLDDKVDPNEIKNVIRINIKKVTKNQK